MSEYMFGVTRENPGRREAHRWDRICREEGGYGYTELNVGEGETPGVNNGRYQGWFSGPNLGSPFDDRLRDRVMDRIAGRAE